MFIVRHSTSRSSYESGFTILELMVASAVFTIILLVVAIGVLSFTNSYYKGITSSKTQVMTRAIMAEITQSIQFGKSITALSGSGNVFGSCIDNTLYSYALGQQVTDVAPQGGLHQDYHGLIVTTGSDCTNATPSLPSTPTLPTGSRELLGNRMRLSALTITPSGNLYIVHIRVLYGDDDLFTPTVSGNTDWSAEFCASGHAGSQFCASSDLTTTIERRLL
jgi:prepilin-type N-terminal cleavage/methylation domain-containing protein